MEINTHNRSQLKSYFVRNAIPTESNFADLIDGMLNQKDDGIAKQADSPLSLEAAGANNTSQKPVIHFYQDFDNNTADWVFNLNPFSAPNDASTAHPGFNIADGAGTSRLFIDQNTGKVGLGTITPASPLDVLSGGNWNLDSSEGDFRIGNSTLRLKMGIALGGGGAGDAYIRAQGGTNRLMIGAGSTPDVLNVIGNRVGINTRGPAEPLEVNGRVKSGALTVGPWPANPSTYVFFGTNALDQSAAGNYALLQAVSSGDSPGRTYLNSPVDIRFRINNADRMILANDGNVGIGTTNPSEKLVVSGGLTVLQQEGWQNVSFQNGWQNYGGTFNTAGYFKDSQGVVHLKGLVRNGAIGTTIFTLPTGYRPAGRELQVVATNPNTAGRVDILSDGNVQAVAGNSGWLSLDGITFRVGVSIIFPGPIFEPIPIGGGFGERIG